MTLELLIISACVVVITTVVLLWGRWHRTIAAPQEQAVEWLPSSDIRLRAQVGIPTLVETKEQEFVQLAWEIENTEGQQVANFTLKYKEDEDEEDNWTLLETDGPNPTVNVPNFIPGSSYNVTVVANTTTGQEFSSRPSTLKIPLPCPGPPRIALHSKQTMITHDTLPLIWEVPMLQDRKAKVTSYTVQYKEDTNDNWVEQHTASADNKYFLSGLKPATSYRIRVVAHSPTVSSPPSDIGGPFTTSVFCTRDQIFRQSLKDKSQRAQSDKDMPLYQLPLQTIPVKAHGTIKKKQFGTPNIAREEKVILIVGATGSGKSTFINGMINFILGSDWTDDFRFRLVEESGSFESQHKSMTKSITVYRLNHRREFKIPYSLTIIDTPGFGDTDGIMRDKEITESINDLFKNPEYGVDHIDAIGFVAQSSLARLTPTQRYIFDSILSLFGRDIANNIFLLITFCDSQKPPVLASIQEANIPYHKSFKFNNSALFASNNTNDEGFDHMFWKMGTKSFEAFLHVLESIEGKSLQLTKEVLEERQQLEIHVESMQLDIRAGLGKLETFKREAEVVRMHEADIAKSRDFTYQVNENRMVHRDLDPGKHVTNCLNCNYTCHYPCTRADDRDKQFCAVMKNGQCRKCKQHCSWDLHRNVPYRIELEVVTVRKTANDLKRRYEIACGEKMNAEKLLKNIIDDFYECQMKVLYLTNEVRKGIKRLNEIALRPNPLSTVDYIDMLITSETMEAHPGWQARIGQLNTVKAQATTIAQVAEDDGYDPFAEYEDMLNEAYLSNTEPGKKNPFKEFAVKVKQKCVKTFNNARKHLAITMR